MDAYEGVLSQTQYHSHLVSLLGVKQAIVATNKMHLVDHDRYFTTTLLYQYSLCQEKKLRNFQMRNENVYLS